MNLDFKYNADGLIPAIVQETGTNRVLMMAWMNRAAIEKTLETGLMNYWSRSRQKSWLKGETSGHTQRVVRWYADCDKDTLLFEVEQTGGACHTGYHSCFFQPLNRDGSPGEIDEERVFDPATTYSNLMTTAEVKPGRDEFRKLARYGNLIPVYTEIVADAETPVSAFSKIDEGGCSFLLESAEHIDHGGRYSFVGSNPRVVFRSRGRTVTVTEAGVAREFETEGDPLAELQKLMARYIPVPLSHLPRFVGGAVGYLGYDMVRFFEPSIGEPPRDDLQLPESLFMVAETLLIFDHQLRRLRVLSNALVENDDVDGAYDAAVQAIQNVMGQLDKPVRLPALNVHGQPQPVYPASNTTEEEFRKMVEQAHEFIHAGDIFQVVLSQRFETAYTGDPLTLYRCLRFVNPSPYLFCLKFGGEFALVGSSPEVHVRAMNGKVEVRPIAGTRRRGNTPEQDDANARDLLADPKERAEHLMLVDLARNDVGRIANFGSVRVTDFMTIEKYSHVMHIVSNVVGQLHPDKNAYDVMRATFPAGTVSGSPKVRAMQIIRELEKTKRGSYAGAVGYFGFDGNSDSCIALRTIALKDGKAYVQAGAGIVADSTPEGEYQETVNKAMGMMRAIERARESRK